jgi:hypothetical protein
MKRPILQAGLIVGALALGQTGCQQAGKTDSASKSKPDDPTAWSDRDLTRDDSDSSKTKSGLPKSSGLKGTLSSEAQDIEKSLGVGSR